MVKYGKTLRENLSYSKFNEEIDKAVNFISDKNGIKKENFRTARIIAGQKYINRGEEFSGDYIIIEISDENKIFGYLNCFLNQEKNFLEIFTIAIDLQLFKHSGFFLKKGLP